MIKKKKKIGKRPWQINTVIKKNLMKFFLREEKMKIREDRRLARLILFFKTALFGHISKTRHIHFLVHGHFSWSTFNLHLVRGPKAF
jgi:hypothetical protein